MVDKRAGAYPAQAQAMAVARAQAVLASLSEVARPPRHFDLLSPSRSTAWEPTHRCYA